MGTYETSERNRQGRRGACTLKLTLSVAAIRWLALWSRPAGTTGLPFGEDPEVLDRWSLREMCSVGLSFTPFVAGSLCFTIKRAPGAAACAFFPSSRKERGHRDFSYSFSFLQKKGRQNYPHSTKQCRRFSETRVFVVSRLLSLTEREGGERIATWLILPVVIC